MKNKKKPPRGKKNSNVTDVELATAQMLAQNCLKDYGNILSHVERLTLQRFLRALGGGKSEGKKKDDPATMVYKVLNITLNVNNTVRNRKAREHRE